MRNRVPWCLKGLFIALLVALLANAGMGQQQEAPPDLQQLEQEAGAWAVPAKNYSATRFSPLDQINTENVVDLEHAWSFSTGVLRGHEGQPLVIEDTMYIVTPYPNHVYALDLTQPEEKPIKWMYEPVNDSAAFGVACCDVVNRGPAYGNGKIVFNTLDGYVHALDAESGELVWRVQNGNVNRAETITMAPLIAGGKVLVGVSGGEFGVRGYITAYDLETGDRLWRWHNTGPDEEVGIKERFKAPYDWLEGEDLGVKTWPKNQWRIGGSTVWGWLSYDPELNLVYYGTANPGTWNPSLRRGEGDRQDLDQVKWANMWSLTAMARDLDTGELAWAYQYTPHSMLDHDSTQEHILVDLEIDGAMRKALVHFDKNGFAYTLDRTTGEVLVAEKFVHTNWAERVDLKTGLPVRNPEKNTAQGENVTNICPSALGGKDAPQAASYSPRTGLFYVPVTNVCMDYEGAQTEYIAGLPYVGAIVKMYPGPGGNLGAFIAWDPVAGERVWAIKEQWAVWSGTLATAGNVVFYGTMDGWLKAVHAESGELLWRFKTGSGIVGAPISYLGPDGKQYIAVYSGIGGWPGLVVASDIGVHDKTSALGVVNAFAELGQYTRKGGTLHVFSIEGSAAGDRGQ
jgi:PQQ-dependent dehydrogenase (methanol/ethanol family)